MGTLRCQDFDGDKEVNWDSRNEVEVEEARTTFYALQSHGYTAFAVGPQDDQGQITTFDPNVQEIVVVPQLAGG